jgi:hypothetical protein
MNKKRRKKKLTQEKNRLLASATVTVAGVAYLTIGPGAPEKQSKHGHGVNVDHDAKADVEERPQSSTASDESARASEGSKSEKEIGPKGADDPQNPDKRSSVGRNVPPLPRDNTDPADNWDEKVKKKQEMDALVRFPSIPLSLSLSTSPGYYPHVGFGFSEGHSKRRILIQNLQNTG